MWYTSGSGRIEFQLTAEDVSTGYHQGSCDTDIAALRTIPRIAKQLAGIDPDVLRNELREYGAWDDDELADHEENLDRILWLACGDLFDNPTED